MRLTIPIIGPTLNDPQVQVNAQRSVNLYPEIEQPGAKVIISLKSTPGLKDAQTIGTGPHRAHMVEFKNKFYMVSGNTLYSLTKGGNVAAVGTLNTATGNVVMVAGRSYLMLVDGTDGYTWNDSVFAVISNVNFPANPVWVTYLDGYFPTVDKDTDRFYINQVLDDPTGWTATDYTAAAANPDNLKAIIGTYRDLYAIGEKTTQVYYNSGAAQFPFDLYPRVLEWGIAAPASLSKSEGALYFLAQSSEGGRVVVNVNELSVRRISNMDLDTEFAGYPIVSDAVGYAYKQAGKTFYVLTFPTADKTFVYHLEQDTWHERKSWGLGRHRSHTYGFFNEKHWVGDYSNGKLYNLDLKTYMDSGDYIERRRITQVLHRNRQDLCIYGLELEFDAGVGATSGQGSDPTVVLRTSWDGGKTWSHDMIGSVGKLGEYNKRVWWGKLGIGPQLNLDIVVTDPVPVTLIAGYADIEVLR